MHDIARRWIIAPVVAFVVIAAGVVVAPASALGAVTGTVKVNGGGVLNVRAGATTASARVGTLRNGAKVSIECQVEGQYIRGDVRATSLWNRLTNGRYISHAYVSAGSIPKCGASSGSSAGSSSGSASGTVKVNGGGVLNVRSGPTTASARVGTLRNGAKVSIECQVEGQYIRGDVRATSLWNRLTNGRYISHAYVSAGSIPKCGASSGSSAGSSSGSASGTVKVNGGGVLNVRSGPTTASARVGTLRNGAKVSIECQVEGQYIRGDVRATSLWNRLTNGRYISHAYVSAGSIPKCGASQPTPSPSPVGSASPAQPMTNDEFIAASVPGAQQGWREFGVPASVTIGQAILESGWGRSALAMNDRNYFGIKCFNNDPGPIASGCRTYRTTECDKDGKCFTTSATFRTYRSMADSFRDHGHFLRSNSRYAPAFAHNRDPDKFLTEIWKAGYATDPKYDTKVIGIMKQYNLYKYDIWR